MTQVDVKPNNYNRPWYALTPNRLLKTLGGLQGEVNCDICIIGGGFTGLSAALELANKGYKVTLVEAATVAGSASGRNGGHVQRGFSKSPDWMIGKYGDTDARMMCDVSVEGVKLIEDRIAKYNIQCDLKHGHLTAAVKERQIADLQDEIKSWANIGYADMQFLDKRETQDIVRTDKYLSGLFDPNAAHFHPLNYALGLAQACIDAGVAIYEQSPVTAVATGATPTVTTENGKVTAKYVLIAGAIDLPQTVGIMRKSMSAQAHMIATEPLGEARARSLITKDIAVIDANFVMSYYRFSADHRLLLGGNCNYSGKDFGFETLDLKKRMTDVFPSLADVKIDHCWHGPLDLTGNRMPHMGRLSPTVYFAHGFGGHGVVATNILGKVMADAVSGSAEKFDVFAKVGHPPIFGGEIMKRPLFVLAMTWFKLRDKL